MVEAADDLPELAFPTNGTIGYKLAYPLMLAVLIELSLLFLTLGVALELAHAARSALRRLKWSMLGS